ncbi:MAG: 4Fe-4S dicluster domain-containing protein [Acidobacteriota bacterium]
MMERAPVVALPPPVRGRVVVLAPRCKGCQYCVEFCPMKVLSLSADYNAKGYRYPKVANDLCIVCHLCETICPDYAIFPVPRIPETPRASGAPPAETRRER